MVRELLPELKADLARLVAIPSVSAATMGATLADVGVNSAAGQLVADEEACRRALAVMMTAGLCETSGDMLCDVGFPGKSGIGGGIVVVAPGKGGLGTYSRSSTQRGTACAAGSPPATSREPRPLPDGAGTTRGHPGVTRECAR